MDKVEREEAQQEMSARQTDGSKRVRDKDLYGSHFQLATPPVVESGQGDNVNQPVRENFSRVRGGTRPRTRSTETRPCKNAGDLD